MRKNLWWAIACLALMTVGMTGCVKVRHIGDRTGRSFDTVFFAQTRVSTQGRAWKHKAMEAELGMKAAQRMQAAERQGSSTSIGVPLMNMQSK